MVIFKEVTYKNILSTGNTPTTIFLDRVPTALITGANGAGKSTFLDALCFGIFGKPYRNINKPQLINTVNDKELLVTVDFEVNNTAYQVIRGVKPTRFEVYRKGILIESDAGLRDYQSKLEGIIGLNFKSFTQIIILGSARYQSFMDLSGNDRRVIIEEILDITVFSKMNSLLKTNLQSTDLDIRENDYQKEIDRTKIDGQKNLIKNIIGRSKESEEKVEEQRKQIISKMNLALLRVGEYDEKLSVLTRPDFEKINDKLRSTEFKGKEVMDKVTSIEKRISFYENTENCHTCKQEIGEEVKGEQITSLSLERDKFSALKPLVHSSVDRLRNELIEARTLSDEIIVLENNRREYDQSIKTMETLLNNMVSASKESDFDSLSVANSTLEEMNGILEKKEKEGILLVEKRHHYEVCKVLLKDDGIKSKIIKQYLPVMNQLINKYLDRMGANYSFNLDESFNEVIKSRYRDSFSYASFSEGEKMRIDLALMFTWREIAKLKNSVNTNLLIMDEVGDSSLDAEATEVLWEILGDLTDTNVFVISHKATNGDKFRSLIEFFKDGNFSKIKESKV